VDYREGLWTVGLVNAGLGIWLIVSGVLGSWSLGVVGGMLLAVGIFSIAAAERNTRS
jgi:hypothetical protein